MTAVGQPTLLHLAVRCPGCGFRPRLRVPADAAALLRETMADLPDAVLVTYECHRRDCRETYPITARAFHRAE